MKPSNFVQKETVSHCGLYVCRYKPRSSIISVNALLILGHSVHSVQSLLPDDQFGLCFVLLFILNIKISPHTGRLNALLCCHLLPSSYISFFFPS